MPELLSATLTVSAFVVFADISVNEKFKVSRLPTTPRYFYRLFLSPKIITDYPRLSLKHKAAVN